MVRPRQASADGTPPPLDPTVGQGDQRMQHLYDLHGAALFRYLLRHTMGEPQAAEDIMQETLLRAWKNLATLHPDLSTLRPWLFTVARRIAIDAGRARRARPAEVNVEDMSTIPDLSDDIERMLNAHTISLALTRITPEHRRVVMEIYYRGRSVNEVARMLGIPEGTVKSRCFNALRALRAAIESTRPPG